MPYEYSNALGWNFYKFMLQNGRIEFLNSTLLMQKTAPFTPFLPLLQ